MKKVPLQSTSPTFEDYPACEIAEACMKLVALILLLSSAGFTQEAKHPISNVLREMLPSRAKNTVGAIEEMPADKFNYKPTPEQMTFGHLAPTLPMAITFSARMSAMCRAQRRKNCRERKARTSWWQPSKLPLTSARPRWRKPMTPS